MKVSELIQQLQRMPQDATVLHLWDGEARTEINVVYESKNGDVITADFDMACYSTSSRPIDAPTSQDMPIWSTREK